MSGGVFVGLGANLGDPAATIRSAIAALDEIPSTRVLRQSRLYRSAPWGGNPDQPDFVNAVVELDTEQNPESLMSSLLAIELQFGRVRDGQRDQPRMLDLDLLSYGTRRSGAAELTLPHPRMHQRAFVLVPLAEIAPDAELPVLGRVESLLGRVDTASVRPWRDRA
jgi:2-amino-4-hydroxy-6-hydroxymethyldihydropteridine diphosphokinase